MRDICRDRRTRMVIPHQIRRARVGARPVEERRTGVRGAGYSLRCLPCKSRLCILLAINRTTSNPITSRTGRRSYPQTTCFAPGLFRSRETIFGTKTISFCFTSNPRRSSRRSLRRSTAASALARPTSATRVASTSGRRSMAGGAFYHPNCYSKLPLIRFAQMGLGTQLVLEGSW